MSSFSIMAGVSATPSCSSEANSPKRSLGENECVNNQQKRLKEDEEEPERGIIVESHKIDVDLLLRLVARLPWDVHKRIWRYYVSMFL